MLNTRAVHSRGREVRGDVHASPSVASPRILDAPRMSGWNTARVALKCTSAAPHMSPTKAQEIS